ncbi:hypothetical protein BH18THE2_BH18THE2_06690 [soil metagenome]
MYFLELVLFVSVSVVGFYDLVESILYLIGTGFSILLLALSVSAYRDRGIKKIKYAIVAFGLFAAFLFYQYLEHAYGKIADTPYTDIILPSMALAIVVLIFLAIVRKK